jgi:hypothetical protein
MNLMVKLEEIFNISSGSKLDLDKMKIMNKYVENETVHFVSRTSKNNGVSAIVKLTDKIPYSSGLITVPTGGSMLEAYIQPFKFYTSQNVFVLEPKQEMTLQEKAYYCLCIRENKYKYNYGRHANRTLKDILVPKYVPKEINKINLPDFSTIKQSLINRKIELDIDNWKWFNYIDLFDIEKGKSTKISELKIDNGKTPIVSATSLNNGVACYTNNLPIYEKNTITVSTNGKPGEAFYQNKEYIATSDVAIYKPKFKLNKYIAMFFIMIIRLEQPKYNYGRKWNIERMKESKMKLPVTPSGEPDFEFMETYIKSLEYSKGLEMIN